MRGRKLPTQIFCTGGIMKVTYIHHSAFLVETDSTALLFDYFQGAVPEIDPDKPLYVFASHSHPDHFSKKIFELAEKYPAVRYILSFDIRKKQAPEGLRERTVFLNPGETYRDGILSIEAFHSTDEGVAFWVSVDGHEIYHAGDLNHWYWDGEEEQWNTEMAAAYRAEIAKMAGRKADAAFLPLDPRLESYFYLGIDDFMKTLDAKHVFPMHFWGEYDVSERLAALPCAKEYKDRIVHIKREGEQWEL